jgi:flagellar biosynthetic protein FliP
MGVPIAMSDAWGMSTKTKHFIRHYIEMVIAMYAGMILLIPFSGAPTGASLAMMGVAMTAPMVAWMRYRGHGWRPCAEMAASMVIPTIAVLFLLATGAVTGEMTLMTVEHVAMFPLMLVAMLIRPDEYTCHIGEPRHA